MNINSNIAIHNPFETNNNYLKDISIPLNQTNNYQTSKHNADNSTLLFSARQLKAKNPLNGLPFLSKNLDKYNIDQGQIDKFSNNSNIGLNLDTKQI